MVRVSKQLFDSPDLALEAGLLAIKENRLKALPGILTSAYTHRYPVTLIPMADDSESPKTEVEEREQTVRCIHSDNFWVLLIAAADKSPAAFNAILSACEKDPLLHRLTEDFMPRYRDTYKNNWDKEAVKGLVRASAVKIQSPMGAEKHAVRMGYHHPVIAAGLVNIEGISDDLKGFLDGISDLRTASALPDPNYLTRHFIVDLINHLNQINLSFTAEKNKTTSEKQKYAITRALGDAREIEKNSATPYDKLCQMIRVIIQAHNTIMDDVQSTKSTQNNREASTGLHDLFTLGDTLQQLEKLGIDVAYDHATRHMKARLEKPDHFRGATLRSKE